MHEAIRSMPEWIASVRIATEPVTAPATSFSAIRMRVGDDRDGRGPRPLAPLARVAAGRRAAHDRSHSPSARAARPRWEIASFSASASSAIVRVSPAGTNTGS